MIENQIICWTVGNFSFVSVEVRMDIGDIDIIEIRNSDTDSDIGRVKRSDIDRGENWWNWHC